MFKIKYKKISDASLDYFAKMIYSDIQKFYNNKSETKSDCKNKNMKGANSKK